MTPTLSWAAPQAKSTWVPLAAVAVSAALLAGRRGSALDVILIGALGLLTPPLAAFAVWFGGWHSLRHSARMLTRDTPNKKLPRRGCVRRCAHATVYT